MDVTFSGVNKLIICGSTINTLDVPLLYSTWKTWVLTNPNFLPAFSVLGGDPLPGGLYVGSYFFLENGWKIRPREANHNLIILGNLFTRDGSSAIVPTLGSYTVSVTTLATNLAQGINTGAGGFTSSDRALIERVRDLLEADEEFTTTTARKLRRGTTDVLLSKRVTGGIPTNVTIKD